MAQIELLQPTEKIKDSYGKINTSLTNLNNAKMEKTADSDLNMNGRSITNIARQNIQTSGSVLTISNGAITVTQSYHVIDTEGSSPEDDLDTINGGNVGDLLILRQNNANRDITIRNQGGGTGNIRTFDFTDIKMEGNGSTVMLIKAGDNWMVIGTNGVKRAGDKIMGPFVLGLTGDGHSIVRDRGSDSPATMHLDFSGLSTASATVAFFRNLNTSGNKAFVIFRGDGTNTAVFRVLNGAIDRLNGQTVTVTAYNGDPNGNVAAPPGSICLDTTNGKVYKKASGSGNTGWQELT